jgi:hypothetical protein
MLAAFDFMNQLLEFWTISRWRRATLRIALPDALVDVFDGCSYRRNKIAACASTLQQPLQNY